MYSNLKEVYNHLEEQVGTLNFHVVENGYHGVNEIKDDVLYMPCEAMFANGGRVAIGIFIHDRELGSLHLDASRNRRYTCTVMLNDNPASYYASNIKSSKEMIVRYIMERLKELLDSLSHEQAQSVVGWRSREAVKELYQNAKDQSPFMLGERVRVISEGESGYIRAVKTYMKNGVVYRCYVIKKFADDSSVTYDEDKIESIERLYGRG